MKRYRWSGLRDIMIVRNSFHLTLKIVMVKDYIQEKDTIIVEFKLIRNQNKICNAFRNL